MSDRTPLISRNKDIIDNLTQFYSEITEFEKCIRDVGTNRDTTTLRSTLHKKKLNLGEDLKVMLQQIKQLPSSKLPKFQQDKIIKQFKEAHSKFEDLLSLSNKKESSNEPIVQSQQPQQQQQQQNTYNNNNNNNNNRGGGFGNNNNNRGGYGQQQQQYQDTYGNNSGGDQYDRLEQALQTGIERDEEEHTERILQERNAQARQLAEDVSMLNEAMRDVSALVSEQGQMLERADENIYTADIHVEESVVHLEKAYVYKSSSRKKVIILIVCVVVTLAAVALFLAIYYGVIKKKKGSIIPDKPSVPPL